NNRRVQPHRRARPTFMPDSPGRLIQRQLQQDALLHPPPFALPPAHHTPQVLHPNLATLARFLDHMRGPPHQQQPLRPAPPARCTVQSPTAPAHTCPPLDQALPDVFESNHLEPATASSLLVPWPSAPPLVPLVPYTESPTSTIA